MTRKEFLQELAKTPRAWSVSDGPERVNDTRASVVRCERGDCPITAVDAARAPVVAGRPVRRRGPQVVSPRHRGRADRAGG